MLVSSHRMLPATSDLLLLLLRCSLHEAVIPSQIKQNPPPPTDEEKGNNRNEPKRSEIQVPRQRYISVSKSELLQAIASAMFPSPAEYRQFLALSQCLDSILHAEHKTILEEMRGYYDDLNLSTKTKAVETDDFPPVLDEDDEHGKEDEIDPKSKLSLPLGLTLNLNFLLEFSSTTAQRDSINTSRVAIGGHFQCSFMKLLNNAEFEELSPRDLMLTSAPQY